jgi:hypothetical protein
MPNPTQIKHNTLLRDQMDVIPSDTLSDLNALFRDEDEEGVMEYANAVMVPATGDVTVVKYNGVEDLMPNLVPGIWHNSAPFRHVKATGTDAATVKVGVTFWRSLLAS